MISTTNGDDRGGLIVCIRRIRCGGVMGVGPRGEGLRDFGPRVRTVLGVRSREEREMRDLSP